MTQPPSPAPQPGAASEPPREQPYAGPPPTRPSHWPPQPPEMLAPPRASEAPVGREQVTHSPPAHSAQPTRTSATQRLLAPILAGVAVLLAVPSLFLPTSSMSIATGDATTRTLEYFVSGKFRVDDGPGVGVLSSTDPLGLSLQILIMVIGLACVVFAFMTKRTGTVAGLLGSTLVVGYYSSAAVRSIEQGQLLGGEPGDTAIELAGWLLFPAVLAGIAAMVLYAMPLVRKV